MESSREPKLKKDVFKTDRLTGDDDPPEGWTRYTVERILGEGGMGVVYQAHDPSLERIVALKFIRGNDEKLRERLLREARAQARIEHDNVCKIYEVGEVQGRSFIAMQYIDGAPLNQLAHGMIPEQKVTIIAQVAEALHAAHQLGIIHRDVKPSNIMVEQRKDGSFRPYLMDFGIARELDAPILTLTEVLGTPHFMSPEQVLGRHDLIDRRTDIYSLGAALYSIIVGRTPHQGSTPAELLFQISKDDPTAPRKLNPNIPPDLETIIVKCMAKEPQYRYQSARALAEDFESLLKW